ncbi:MAG: Fic family protein [Atopobiaceae bacterium]|jgi:Fic family protein|nr:Fic family protein [Atopobiaceae bacterium]MCI2173528.1 Fic family protein [Atopobiaceae bacterium]MCI2207523.1 Fic family protein [Atopobiaceae bacterium]
MDLEGLYEGICDWWGTLDEESKAKELAAFAPEFAYNSASIEDSAVTREDTEQVFSTGRVSSYSGELSTLNLIQDQRDTFARVLADVDHGRPFDEGLVLEAHAALTWGTYSPTQLADGERPGTYKLGDYLVPGVAEVGAPAADAPRLVRELADEISGVLPSLTRKKALTVASYFHCSFETIHPFSDGSGLTGRTLMNYILLSGFHPPVIIFETDKQPYFEALESFNAEGDLTPFKKLLMAETIKSWRERARS